MSDHYVITIARGFGSGGKTIGINLGEELGIPCYVIGDALAAPRLAMNAIHEGYRAALEI